MTSGVREPLRSPRDFPSRRPGRDAAWDALDRFIQTAQDVKQVLDQYRPALAAIREGTLAEHVFLYSEAEDRVLEASGDPAPAHRRYRELIRELTRECPDGGTWEAPESLSFGDSGGGAPTAAAILPVETARSSWLVALRFRLDDPFRAADVRVMRVIWQLEMGRRRHARLFDNLKETLFGVVRCLSTAIDAKDPYTCGHSERVARIAVRLGEEMRLSRGAISDLYLAGLLHDVGKIGIRDDVLRKDGPLTPEEYDHIKEHPVTGERIIANVTRLAYLRPGVRGHHERFDGRGYPDGLAGEAIPQMARILAVADSCDAMMSTRRYRPALSPTKIETIFQEGAGTQWDPRIVEHFLACRHELYAVYQRGLGQSVYMAVERAAGGDPASDHRTIPSSRHKLSGSRPGSGKSLLPWDVGRVTNRG